MRRIAHIGALCALAILINGCAGPQSHFFTLSRVAAPATPAATPANLSVVVGPVSIPAIVDLPQIVVNTGPNQVTLDEFNRWASPLQNNISRVVAENLVVLLGTPRVSLFQQSLNAVWIVRNTRDGKSQTGRTTVREPSPGKAYDELAAAHSRALARMSQDIADAIRGLDRAR